MTAILIPPLDVYRLMKFRTTAVALAIQRWTGTTLSIKTINKLMSGQGRQSKAISLVNDMERILPGVKAKIETAEVRIRAKFSPNTDPKELELAASYLSWQYLIIEAEDGWDARGKNTASPIERFLAPLDTISTAMTIRIIRGDLASAQEIFQGSPLATFVPSHLLAAVLEAKSCEEINRALIPVRLIGLLYILAAFESMLDWDRTGPSPMECCLPITDSGREGWPFSRFLDEMMDRLKMASREEVSTALMYDDDPEGNAPQSQGRRQRRWSNGMVPEFTSFSLIMKRYRLLKTGLLATEGEDFGIKVMYQGLLLLHFLARVELTPWFSGKKQFFDIYRRIVQSMH